MDFQILYIIDDATRMFDKYVHIPGETIRCSHAGVGTILKDVPIHINTNPYWGDGWWEFPVA